MKVKTVPPQRFFLPCGTYPFDILCFINQENKTVQKTLIKYFTQEQINESHLIPEKSPPRGRIAQIGNRFVLRLWDFHPHCADCYSILAHEIFHSVEILFDIIGIKHIDSTSEAFAYQIQFLVKSFILKVKEK